jgi:Fic family protein
MTRPPFTITAKAAGTLAKIERLLGTWEGELRAPAPPPRLRRQNRLRTVLDTVAIEGNRLSLEQATAILDGKRVRGTARELLEIQNANRAYESVGNWNPLAQRHLLAAHRALMTGLVADAGRFRNQQVGVLQGTRVAHLAPPPHRVPDLMRSLFRFVRREREAPAIVVALVFHYELELIHPFSDGNGRIGRLWQHALLRRASLVFEHVPAESLIRKQQRKYYGALAASDRLGRSDPFVEYMLQVLLSALRLLGTQLRSKPETASDRLKKAKRALGRRGFSRKDYLALFPKLSTASASRDLANAVKSRQLAARGARALMRYRFL